MATIPCAWCNLERVIMHREDANARTIGVGTDVAWHKEVIRGVVVCANCHQETYFETRGNTATLLPGKLLEIPVSRAASADAAEMMREAMRCFYGTSYRGVVAFCRSAIEEALDDKNAKGNDLNDKIEYSRRTPTNQQGILEDDDVARAHGARLTGRNALHRMENVSASQALLALRTAVDLINHIAAQPAMP